MILFASFSSFFVETVDLLEKAKELINEKEDNKSSILITKIEGIRAGYYLKIHEYEKAAEIHNQNLVTRKGLLSPQKFYLSGISSRGIATAFYYLGKEAENNNDADSVDYFRKSFEFNTLALDYFDKDDSEQSKYERAITEIRRAGSLIKMERYIDHNAFCSSVNQMISSLQKALAFLETLEDTNSKEISKAKEMIELFKNKQ